MRFLTSCAVLAVLVAMVICADEKRDTEKRNTVAWHRAVRSYGAEQRRNREKRWSPFIFNKNGKRAGPPEKDADSDLESIVKDVLTYIELRESGMWEEVIECLTAKLPAKPKIN